MKQEKIIKNLVHFARNEETGLKKVKMLKRISNISGWLILLVCFTLAFQETDLIPAWILTFGGAFAGALIGLGIWFENTLMTWPTLRQFVDLERLRNYGNP